MTITYEYLAADHSGRNRSSTWAPLATPPAALQHASEQAVEMINQARRQHYHSSETNPGYLTGNGYASYYRVTFTPDDGGAL